MPENENPGGTPDNTEPVDETPPDQGQPKGGDQKPTLEDVQAKLATAEQRIKELNHESTDRRKKLERYEADDKKRKEAELSEIEKAQSRQKELETSLSQRDAELRTLRIQAAVERTASKLKFRDPQDAYHLIEKQLADVEIDDQGQVKGIDELLTKLSKDKPYLLDTGNGKDKPPDIDAHTNSKKKKELEEEALRRDFRF